MKWRNLLNRLLIPVGYELKHTRGLGTHPRRDMARLVSDGSRVVVFDVGANEGDTATGFKRWFPDCEIHAFEPDPAAYGTLKERMRRYPRVELNNVAVGSACGSQTFKLYTSSQLNSFLDPAESWTGRVEDELSVGVTDLDSYCDATGVEYISILKTDTQGYELEVLKGAQGLMADNRIHMIFVEIIFSKMYDKQAHFLELMQYLVGNRFSLVAFYKFHEDGGVASWADALFVNLNFSRNRSERLGSAPGQADPESLPGELQ